MAAEVSGVRFARSHVTPAGAEVVSREIDFDLGARLGIKILWTLTSIQTLGNPTADVNLDYLASVHLESDALEDLPVAAGDDEDNIDSEVIHLHPFSYIHSESAAGLGASVGSSHLHLVHDPSIVFARNPTFRGESVSASGTAIMHLLMAYKYVELTNAELIGVLTSRR